MKTATAFAAALVLALLLPALPLAAQTTESLNFLSGLPDFEHVRDMLPEYLNRVGMSLLEERARQAAMLRSADDIARRRAYLRERMLRAIGGLPERTPLNARVVGVLERDGYRVEKVLFESQPRFWVTGNLYLPKTGRPPYPAVLYPLGHERGGKSYPVWQQMLATLARRGYVAFTWETLGQGERSQFYDADFGDSKLGVLRYTTEHSMLGAQCLLVGDNLARYTIWDGIRALDYLLSRPEVDPAKVAVTGNSGGGTHTAYLAALDDRIGVAAPSCYLTSWSRLLVTLGPQDAEQVIPPSLKDGLDHADFVYAFAPKPYLMLSAIRDFFSISGARQTFEEASRGYSAIGSAERLRMFEADDGHGYSKPRRLAAYRWFGRWLKGAEDDEPEAELAPEPDEELRCTESGQVMASLGGETVFSLNLKRAQQVKPNRAPLLTREAVAVHQKEVQQRMRELIAFDPRQDRLPVRPFGEIRREGYRIEKLIYESEPGILVPAVLLIPDPAPARAPAVLYVNGKGKNAGRARVEELVKDGFVVLAIDARGTGETAVQGPPDGQAYSGYFGNYADAMRALLVGKTLVGLRAADIVRGIDLLAARPEVDASRISGFGAGNGAVALLHAAVLEPRITRLVLEEMLFSYESVVEHRIHRDVFESVVPGVLKAYDLPDLLAAVAPRPLWVVNAIDPMGNRMSSGEVRRQYARPFEAFQALAAANAIRISVVRPDAPLEAIAKGLK